MMRSDQKGALPMLAVLVIIGAVLLFVGLIVIAITIQAILALFLAGAGVYLLLRPERMAGMPQMAKLAVPIILIVLAIGVFGGWWEVG